MGDERTPPTRIRITGLQEAQLPAVVEVDHACTAMYYDAGFDGAEVPADATNAPRSRRATGASTVLDADFTNSPISLSFSRTTLLSTPSSLASSWTRTLATLLLLVRALRGTDR